MVVVSLDTAQAADPSGLTIGIDGASRAADPDGAPAPPVVVAARGRAHLLYDLAAQAPGTGRRAGHGEHRHQPELAACGRHGRHGNCGLDRPAARRERRGASSRAAPARPGRRGPAVLDVAAQADRRKHTGGGGLMVAPGFFVVHDAVRPPLTDGDYQLLVSQTMSVSEASIDPAVRSFRLVGPRYTLPPDQVLSVFPPPNGTGSFADRLPQIVLRRRTLPYERTMKPGDPPPAPPWLALVVLADGEGQLLTSQPLDATLPEQDDKDAPVRDVLQVSERVVQAVFPALEDLPWLTHVREVDISDTEMALGDDDGWLAVVIANRLPVTGPPDTEGGPPSPRHYTAFLVSLEGHEGDLPVAAKAPPPQQVFTTSHVYSDTEIAAAVLVAEREQRSPLQSSIGGLRVVPQAQDGAPAAARPGGRRRASGDHRRAGPPERQPGRPRVRGGPALASGRRLVSLPGPGQRSRGEREGVHRLGERRDQRRRAEGPVGQPRVLRPAGPHRRLHRAHLLVLHQPARGRLRLADAASRRRHARHPAETPAGRPDTAAA